MEVICHISRGMSSFIVMVQLKAKLIVSRNAFKKLGGSRDTYQMAGHPDEQAVKWFASLGKQAE